MVFNLFKIQIHSCGTNNINQRNENLKDYATFLNGDHYQSFELDKYHELLYWDFEPGDCIAFNL